MKRMLVEPGAILRDRSTGKVLVVQERGFYLLEFWELLKGEAYTDR